MRQRIIATNGAIAFERVQRVGKGQGSNNGGK